MAHKGKTHIYSIYGQIDAVVANMMVEEGKLSKIDRDMIPPTQMFDEQGRQAFFAVVMPHEHLREYHDRVRDLYA